MYLCMYVCGVKQHSGIQCDVHGATFMLMVLIDLRRMPVSNSTLLFIVELAKDAYVVMELIDLNRMLV